jgi:hypothetical protein
VCLSYIINLENLEFEPDLGNQIKKITMYKNDMKKYFKTQLNI